MSPYAFVYNNPCVFADPDGKSGKARIQGNEIIVSSKMVFYGSKVSNELAQSICSEIQSAWNAAGGSVSVNGKEYSVKFKITSETATTDEAAARAKDNLDVEVNFVKVSESNADGRSWMTIGGNSAEFVTTDDLGNSTTAPHEYGHGLGQFHSSANQIGKGQPDMMAARGTKVDPEYQYDPKAKPGEKGGTVNPYKRRVTPENVRDVFTGVKFDKQGQADIGKPDNKIIR
jgi:hypothetical protein